MNYNLKVGEKFKDINGNIVAVVGRHRDFFNNVVKYVGEIKINGEFAIYLYTQDEVLEVIEEV